jgi:hypothetical protein
MDVKTVNLAPQTIESRMLPFDEIVEVFRSASDAGDFVELHARMEREQKIAVVFVRSWEPMIGQSTKGLQDRLLVVYVGNFRDMVDQERAVEEIINALGRRLYRWHLKSERGEIWL